MRSDGETGWRSDDQPCDGREPFKSYPGRRQGLWLAAILLCIGLVGLERLVLQLPGLWPRYPFAAGSFQWYKDLLLTLLVSGLLFRLSLAVARLYATSVSIFKDRIQVKEWYGREKSFSISLPVELKCLARLGLPGGRSIEMPFSTKWCYLLKVGRHSACLLLSDESDTQVQADELRALLSQLST